MKKALIDFCQHLMHTNDRVFTGIGCFWFIVQKESERMREVAEIYLDYAKPLQDLLDEFKMTCHAGGRVNARLVISFKTVVCVKLVLQNYARV